VVSSKTDIAPKKTSKASIVTSSKGIDKGKSSRGNNLDVPGGNKANPPKTTGGSNKNVKLDVPKK